jgi:RNA recognition motif-containing protein
MDFASMKRVAEPYETDLTKRQKIVTAGASKVLHVRGLPSHATETELVSMVAQFGRVAKTLILHDKNQAFIQMDSLDAAARAVAGLESNPPVIRTKMVYVQYSSRQEIDHKSAPVVGAEGVTNGTSATLIIMITNVTIPVTLDNIYQICKPYGDVLRIITFNKGADFQALVQFGTAEHAEIARSFLDGKDLFQGCCHLRVSFSKRQHLVVKQNDSKSRDFTQPDLPQVGGGLIQGMGHQGLPQGMMSQLAPGALSLGGQDRSPVVLVSKLDDKVTPEVLFTLFGVYGDVQRVKILYNKRENALVQFATAQQADYARSNLNGCPLYGQQINVNNSKYQTVQMPREPEGKELTRDFVGSEFHRYKKKSFINPKNVNQPSAVLHVANIHESVSEQELRDLFQSASPNSRVVVEFFKTNRSQAYVALGSIAEGVNALINFHNFKVREYPLRVSFSPKHPESVRDSDSLP